jgi:ribosomal protein S18 acetylase RimI-like enzyme
MLLRSLKARVQQSGLRAAMRGALGTIFPDRFEVWKLSGDSVSRPNHLPASNDVLAGPSAMETLKHFRESTPGLPVEFYRDEIDSAQRCFLACHEGRLAAIAWSYNHAKKGHFLGMSLGDAEIRSLYSLPEFRGHGLAKAVIETACDTLQREGIRNIYAVIHFRNEASLRAFRSAGFTKVGELRRPPLFGPRFVTATGYAETWFGALARVFRLS